MDLETDRSDGPEKTGWKLPETFCVKAADGVTTLYGNMWKPFDFDPKKKYPIIAHVYPGPQQEGVTHTFSARTAAIMQLAQLGFIVIQVGHRGGTPDAIEGVPQLRLLQPARLRPGRQEGGDRATGGAAPVHRHRPRRHLRPLRRRVPVGRGPVAEAVQRVLQGRGRVGRQPRQQHLQRQLVRALSRPEGSARSRRKGSRRRRSRQAGRGRRGRPGRPEGRRQDGGDNEGRRQEGRRQEDRGQ